MLCCHFQVSVHVKGSTECYECQPRSAAQKSYPICTLRNTPDKPIHCVVWGKELLFPRLFGKVEVSGDGWQALTAGGRSTGSCCLRTAQCRPCQQHASRADSHRHMVASPVEEGIGSVAGHGWLQLIHFSLHVLQVQMESYLQLFFQHSTSSCHWKFVTAGSLIGGQRTPASRISHKWCQ